MAKTTKKKTASKKKAATTKKKTTARAAASKKKTTSTKKTAATKKSTTKKKVTQSKSTTSRKTTTASKAKSKTKATSKSTTKKGTMSKAATKTTSTSAATLEGILGFTPYKEKKGEEYMSDAQKEHFKQILEAWKKQLMQEVDRTLNHMQDEASNLPDPSDRATLEEEFSLELRTRDRERKLIKKIDSTLELIKNDEYGYCDTCGIEIGIRRLEARPTANQCIDCKTLDEIKERQFGG